MRELDVYTVPLTGVQLVEASAGTGKTWTLCALLLRLLLERGLDLRQILVVTFTTAATAELRERVRRRLVEALAQLDHPSPSQDPLVPTLLAQAQAQGQAPEALRRRLQDALASFDEAAIHTIHGFAQRSLGELGFAAGEPAHFETLQDEAGLRLQLAQAWWRREVVPAGKVSPLLLDVLGAEGPEVFAEQLGEHLRLPLARCVWPPAVADDTALEARVHALLAEAQALWAAERDRLRALLEAALPRLNGTVYRASALASAFEEWGERLTDLSRLLQPIKKDSKLKLLRRDQLDEWLKKNQTAVDQHPFQHLAAELLDAGAALQDQLDAQRRHLRARWLQEGAEELARLKAQQGLLGFDDMLRRLHALLERPEALAQLRARYPAALVDEFQDTDPLQYASFRRLFSGEGACCFFVGDPKQAIYRFRQADLPTYLQARAEADAVWTLQHNQRSTPELLDALNALFGRHDNAFLQPGLRYHPVQAGSKPKPVLSPAEPGAALQLWTWDAQPLKDVRRLVLAQLAADIARRLHPVHGDRLDGRPLQPQDLAVLVRTHRQAGWVMDALRASGIESVALGQGSVWTSTEAAELQQLLELLFGPPSETRERAMQASVALGGDAEALAAQSDADPRWSAWRQRAREAPLAAFLHAWLQESGAAQRLLALPQGERRLTNWLHAIELLHAAQHAHASPQALLAWLRRQRHERNAGGEDALLRLESDAQRVPVVTVHRSKGLEYPVVYVPFAFEGEPARRGSGWSLRHRDTDGTQVLDYAAAALDDAAKDANALEDAAEALRLHYVALTRAALVCVVAIGPYGTPASRRAPLHALVAGEGQANWPRHTLDDAAIAGAWAQQAQAPHTGLRHLDPDGANTATVLPRATQPALAARPAPARLPALHWVGSFSRLIQPADHGAVSPSEAPEALPPDDFLRFPRGSLAGDCLHAALEHALLQEPASWPAAVHRALAEHSPQTDADSATQALWATQLMQALQHAANTPLVTPHGPFRLRDLPTARQRREWAFHLHTPEVNLAALPALLGTHGLPVPALRLQHLRGFLRGFVDLVFEHRGRFYVADWKSNHLGFTAADYRDCTPTVAASGYALQALLYQLALHRHLRQTLRGYEPATHLGGAVLLFVRGLRPDFDPGCGQWWLPPDVALLNDLDHLFA